MRSTAYSLDTSLLFCTLGLLLTTLHDRILPDRLLHLVDFNFIIRLMFYFYLFI